jgi:hypothetical protein
MHRALLLISLIFAQPTLAGECDDWQQLHPEWIFCDDFESTGPMVAPGRYFEYGDNDGDCVVMDGVGLDSSRGMRTIWQVDEIGAGGMKLAFGRNPNGYMNRQQIRPDEDFREIYYRMYLRMQEGWQGRDPAKLSRATVFTSAGDWRQAMIAHLWSDTSAHLLLDPASCVDAGGNVVCTTYNDFPNLHWLGNRSGITPLFDSAHDDTWFRIEHHVKLNDPGETNGVQEFWIDEGLEARRENLNFIGTYTDYAINAVFFENYWNSGSPKVQERYFDNIVVSTQPIGPYDPGSVGWAGRAAQRLIPAMRASLAGSTLHLRLAGPTGEPWEVVLHDLTGRRVCLLGRMSPGEHALKLPSLSTGMYRATAQQRDGAAKEGACIVQCR